MPIGRTNARVAAISLLMDRLMRVAGAVAACELRGDDTDARNRGPRSAAEQITSPSPSEGSRRSHNHRAGCWRATGDARVARRLPRTHASPVRTGRRIYGGYRTGLRRHTPSTD